MFADNTLAEAGAAPEDGAAQAGALQQHAHELHGRVIVAVAPDEEFDHAEQLLRSAARLAVALGVAWTVVSVETPVMLDVRRPARDSRLEVFRLAESLGGETTTLEGSSAAEVLIQYARLSGASAVVLGAPRTPLRLPLRLWPGAESVAARLVRAGLDAEMIVVPRSGATLGSAEPGADGLWSRRWMAYVGALGVTALCTAVALPMLDHFDLIDMVMVYMLGATLAALRLGRGPAILCALANIAAFDYLFIPPRFSFWVSDPHYAVTFAVMLGVAATIASLVAAVRQQTAAAVTRERRTAVLYAMSRELAVTRDAATMAAVAERHVVDAALGQAVVLTRNERGQLRDRLQGPARQVNPRVCDWVAEHRERAGLGTGEFAAERTIYLPLSGSQDLHGVLVVTPADRRRALLPDQQRLLAALASLLGLALERVHLVDVVQSARLAAERATLRNTLLASISHDLRTPLSAIAGAGSMMAHENFPLDVHRRTTLGRLIEDKARDMTELLSNVLELMRLETATVAVKGEWQSLEDLVGQTLRQVEARLGPRILEVDVPADLPAVFVEGRLIVQLLNNLLENCVKYTPPGTTIRLAAAATDEDILISVEDDGPGFPGGDPERLFDKFERGRVEDSTGGVGLGLAICRAVARLHGGEIRGLRAGSGGARVEVRLPRKPWRTAVPT